MRIPSLKQAEESIRAEEADCHIMICKSCRAPLWKISKEMVKYGTRTRPKWISSYKGVPEYYDIWSKDGTSCSQVNCPHCSEMYFDVLTDGGKYFPKPTYYSAKE